MIDAGMRVGADVIEIDRISAALDRFPGFACRVLTDGEMAIARLRRDLSSFVAGRFAAKEAVAKALGGRFGWHDVEILSDGTGGPRVALRGRAKDAARGVRVALSISHAKTVATAVAIATPAGREQAG
jgi:holo-[acyl-carrier protein] synthase